MGDKRGRRIISCGITTNRIGAAAFVRAISRGLAGLTGERLHKIQNELESDISQYGFGSLSFVKKRAVDRSAKLFTRYLRDYRFVETRNLNGNPMRCWVTVNEIKTWPAEDFENIIWIED